MNDSPQSILSLPGATSPDELTVINFFRTHAATLCLAPQPVLDQLDPKVHSLPYAVLLHHYIRLDMPWQRFAFTFAAAPFKRPATPAGMDQLRDLAHALVDCQHQCRAVPMLLARMALRLGTARQGHALSWLHPLALATCLETEVFEAALPLITLPLSDFDASGLQTSAATFLLYQYYAGLLFLNLHRLSSARLAFTLCLYCPGSLVSAIQIDAYKRAILTGLVTTGRPVPLPSQMQVALMKTLQTECAAYLDLAEAATSGDAAKFLAVVEKYTTVFAADETMGLLGQVGEAVAGRKIKALTKTYLTLSLAVIAVKLGPEMELLLAPLSLEEKICRMIEGGEVGARISRKGAGPEECIVYFDEEGARDSVEGDVAERIYREIAGVMDVTRLVESAKESMEKSTIFTSVKGFAAGE